MNTKRFLFVCAAALLPHIAIHSAPITIDSHSAGRTFEGIGAVSAGASSRLLIDYPEPQRSEILDYLFKPNCGASLQHLKVEVGGDINSTDGTEPSHMRTRNDLNLSRGYEWWLMKEAKKRNPDIVLDCLAWGAPAWIGDGKYYSQDMADYLVKFLKGAKSEHGLDISYVGIWNEKPHDSAWIKLLRKSLDNAGLKHVRIVATDETGSRNWAIASELGNDPELNAAIAAIGAHYPKYQSPPEALASGKPLWSSEQVSLASGEAPFASDVWHTLKLKFQGTTIEAWIDGKKVADVKSDLTPAGMAGFGCGWHGAQFDNLKLAVEMPPKTN